MGLLDIRDISPSELAQQATDLGKEISEDYIRRMLREGKLVGKKIGGSWRIPIQVAERFLEWWLDR